MSWRCFGPALYHLAHRKRSRLAALVGTIKFFAIEQRAFVVALYRIRGSWFWSRAGFQNFVLQTTGQRNDALFGLVGRQRTASPSLSCWRLPQFWLWLLACLHFGLKFRQSCLGLFVGQLRGSGQAIL